MSIDEHQIALIMGIIANVAFYTAMNVQDHILAAILFTAGIGFIAPAIQVIIGGRT